ncbi:NAD-dependent protein deacetylase, SIR2 family [Bernardetia litoralis DSM 6794]|uniref:protein acetyllysine N-acetyltransferase n=1 Tax=Bernardetia litoralis (strain ATCC 23117 / DSM 6794 / NBRC 15988 / NCIMB 1366 / Fx l1 / Sio-4) TaxID=880071 RepID=I4AQY6_BERLS|nr:Sir2 family NAD-dependent protein deacetylase [Bernardetia litoralis]AFM06371.1 NAD-dependent protein deacetylase, SIR2 family [Bernardetia litoralis DSM 6794]
MEKQTLETISNWLKNADAIVITAGAGMGVDSGLADYRGEDEGQWGKVETETEKTVFETVNPAAFLENPAYSWNLFGKRMEEYENTEPHNGFYILKNWIKKFDLDYFIITSNIDSHFQKAGFEEEKIRELHGSLAYFQSSNNQLSDKIWKTELTGKQIQENSLKNEFPLCPSSKIMARPNVYMFRDATFVNTRTKAQEKKFQAFLDKNKGKNIVVFEIGSGPHVQAVRMKTRFLRSNYDAKIIRINPKDFKVKAPHIGIDKGALKALTEIDDFLNIKQG